MLHLNLSLSASRCCWWSVFLVLGRATGPRLTWSSIQRNTTDCWAQRSCSHAWLSVKLQSSLSCFIFYINVACTFKDDVQFFTCCVVCVKRGGQSDVRLQQAAQCLTDLIKVAAQTPGNYILDQVTLRFRTHVDNSENLSLNYTCLHLRFTKINLCVNYDKSQTSVQYIVNLIVKYWPRLHLFWRSCATKRQQSRINVKVCVVIRMCN